MATSLSNPELSSIAQQKHRLATVDDHPQKVGPSNIALSIVCLLYTSDAADD